MGFVRSWFDTNELLLVGHFFPHLLAVLLCTHSKPQLCGFQISRRPNFQGAKVLGTKKIRGPNEVEDLFGFSHKIVEIPLIATSNIRIEFTNAV